MHTVETSLALSAAIRLGAMLRPQAFGGFFKSYSISVRMLMGYPVDETLEVRTCALGAALDAIGISADQFHAVTSSGMDHQDVFPPQWTELLAWNGRCPACSAFRILRVMDLEMIVTHLNDAHKWSREDIATVVESVELRLRASAALRRGITVTAL